MSEPTPAAPRRAGRAPLRIRVLHHPASREGVHLARHVYKTFMQDAGSSSPRIPVLFTPAGPPGTAPAAERLDLDTATHSLVVVLIDAMMGLRAGPDAAAEAWGNLVVDLLDRAPLGRSPHAVLPVALDGRAFDLDGRLERASMIRLDVPSSDREKEDDLTFHISVWALYLLLQGVVPSERNDRDSAPVELFISHSKVDLPSDLNKITGPVKSILAELAQGPVAHWYDAKHIPPGGRFDEEIQGGVLKSSAMVCVVTNRYSSREWCRREALEAKRAGRPILIVNALTTVAPRTFPYLGNAPEVRWNTDADARRVIRLAVREALRYQHGVKCLEARQQDGDFILGSAPEALTVARLPPKVCQVQYPDPPVGLEELDLLTRIAPNVEFSTPLSRLARWQRPPGVDLIGLSLSTSPDAMDSGLSDEHLATFAEDACLFLLLCGLRLGYGGMIGYTGSGTDYVQRLFQLARGHSPLGKQIGVDFHPIVNYVGWPIHLRFGAEEYAQYGKEAKLLTIPQPSDLGLDQVALGAEASGYFPAPAASGDEGLQTRRRYAWARGMTAMRQQMNVHLTARLVIGGRLDGYSGLLPGVFEEALLCLRSCKPLYLVGAFGGAARAVAEGLAGASPALTTAVFRERVPHYDATVALFKRERIAIETPEAIAGELRDLGRHGPAAAMKNGLDDDENQEMFTTTDPLRMVELLLLGLRRWSVTGGRPPSS